jgi:hypothetical protein
MSLVLFTTRLRPTAPLANKHPGRWCRRGVFCLGIVALGACRDSFAALTDGSPRTPSRAEELFAALGARVTEPLRDAKYESARMKIFNAALLPSRVWGDTGVWTSQTNARRTLLIRGRFVDGRYRLDAERTVAAPSQSAESRHVIELTRLADGEYAWDTDVPYAIGTTSARQFGRFVGALLASAEGRNEERIRADYRAVVPRMSAVLGQLFTVDSIRTVHHADRSTSATFAVTMNPAGVATRYPNFAQYMRRYVETGRMKFTLTDRTGASYFEVSAINGRMTLKVRTLNGALIAASGPARAIPDSLVLKGEVAMKVRRFTVGFHDYNADFTVIRTDRERAFNIVSRDEPEWTLPLITEHLIRTPLRRPFQGNGAQFRIGVRDSAGAQTILGRQMHLEVQESLILRFIGRLGSIAASDFRGKVEREQHAWLREVFEAAVMDLKEGGRRKAEGDP